MPVKDELAHERYEKMINEALKNGGYIYVTICNRKVKVKIV